jgi:hypothetical protein
VHSIHPLPGTFGPEEMALHDRWSGVFDWVGGSAFLASVALFWYTRKSRRSARFLLDLALAYEVFIALNIGILNYAVAHPLACRGSLSSSSCFRRSFPALRGKP